MLILRGIHWMDQSLQVETFTLLFHIMVTVMMLFTHAQAEDYNPYLDLRLIRTETTALEGRQLCRDLGYDGLAVLKSNRAYQDALSLTENYRTQKGESIYIGATVCMSQNKVMWDDGQVASDDNIYWGNQPPAKKFIKPKVVLGVRGDMWMSPQDTLRASLCGKYNIKPIPGRKLSGQQPEVLDSTLTSVTRKVNYFLLCVSLCGHDSSCVAVEFNSDLLTCTILQAGAYSNLNQNPASTTFVKN